MDPYILFFITFYIFTGVIGFRWLGPTILLNELYDKRSCIGLKVIFLRCFVFIVIR